MEKTRIVTNLDHYQRWSKEANSPGCSYDLMDIAFNDGIDTVANLLALHISNKFESEILFQADEISKHLNALEGRMSTADFSTVCATVGIVAEKGFRFGFTEGFKMLMAINEVGGIKS